MLLSKTKLALAIIAATAISGAAQATEVKLGGVVQTKYTFAKSQNSKPSVDAGDVRFHLNVSETKDDLTGYASYSLNSDSLSGGTVSAQNVATGVKGSFGDFRLGEVWKTNDGEFANDLHGFSSNGDAEAHIGYQNTFGPVTATVAFSPEGSKDETRLGLSGSLGGGIEVGAAVHSFGASGAGDNTIFGAKADLGVVTVAAHVADVEYDAPNSVATDTDITAFQISGDIGAWNAALTVSDQDANGTENEKTRLDLGTSIMDGVGVSFRHDKESPAGAADIKSSRIQLSVEF